MPGTDRVLVFGHCEILMPLLLAYGLEAFVSLGWSAVDASINGGFFLKT